MPSSISFLRSLARQSVIARSQVHTQTRTQTRTRTRSNELRCTTARAFSNANVRGYPRKDSQDRESINTDATEYSKSGTDDQSAAQEKAAFDPEVTSPEAAKDVAGEGKGPADNPLEVSPANREVSKQRNPTEGGAENSGKE